MGVGCGRSVWASCRWCWPGAQPRWDEAVRQSFWQRHTPGLTSRHLRWPLLTKAGDGAVPVLQEGDLGGPWGRSLLLPGLGTPCSITSVPHRMASCGQGSVRLWRLRGGELRSCPVDLGEHRVLELTGLAFGQAQDGHML